MKKPLILCWCCGLAIALIMLFGFNTTPTAPERTPQSVALLTQEDTGSFLLQLRYGAEAAADETGDVFSVLRLNANEPEKQLGDLQTNNVKAVLVYGADDATTQRMSAACMELGMPLVLLDSLQDGAASVSTDEAKTGALLVKAALSQQTHGLILLTDGSAIARQRLDSAIRQLRGNPIQQTVVTRQGDEWLWTPTAQSLLDEGACLVAFTGEATLFMGQRKTTEGLSNPLVGVDPGNDRVSYLESGTAQALVLPAPYTMGYLGFKAAKALISGEESSGGAVAPKLIALDVLYDPENVKIAFPLLQ